MKEKPHEPWGWWLKNGNPPGDMWSAPRCGARNRRGAPCECPALRGRRRCRLHGGLSTGARTPAGRERSQQAVTKHGRYSRARREERRETQELLREWRRLMATLT
jgi:hypothetical protein